MVRIHENIGNWRCRFYWFCRVRLAIASGHSVLTDALTMQAVWEMYSVAKHPIMPFG